MNIEKLKLNQKLEIEQIEYLEILLKDFGAILAGGTAYEFFKGTKIKKHLKAHTSSDLDLYFRKESDYKEAIEFLKTIVTASVDDKEYYRPNNYLSGVTIEKSVTGLCHNFINADLKYQLVGCVFGEPEEVITSFDFKNLEVAYHYDTKKKAYLCVYSDYAKNTSELNIRHSRSPFLMHRVYKYLNYRGFDTISSSSKQHITDWIIKASSGFYSENTDGCPTIYVDLLDNYTFRRMLSNKDLISDDDLVFMIGKIKEDIHTAKIAFDSRGYSRSTFVKEGERDIVIEEMRNRRENENQ